MTEHLILHFFHFSGQRESTVMSAWMDSRKKRGVDTQGLTRLSASAATATATLRSATTTRPWTRWAWAWTSTATSLAAESATTATHSQPESTARRVSTGTTDLLGCFPTTQRPAVCATALTIGTLATARQRMVCASAKRLTGGQKTAQLVHRFVFRAVGWLRFMICCGRSVYIAFK